MTKRIIMTKLYLTTGNELDYEGYTSLNGYTMLRESIGYGIPWVLRDPNGEFVDSDNYRLFLADRYDFELEQNE